MQARTVVVKVSGARIDRPDAASLKSRPRNVDFKQVTVTLEALGERHGGTTVAVVTSDGAAWSWPDLFDQFAPLIRSFARSRGSSSPDDIVQDVFTTAIERFPRFDGDSTKLRSFLFTLAYRRIADEHRIRYRRQEQLVADHQPTADDGIDTEDEFTFREEAAEAMRALDILGDRERRVIEMRVIEESSPSEVAEALGLSNGNVRVIQARALMKIRKYLESRSGAMPSISLVVVFLKGLRSELPANGGMAEWIEMLRSASGATIKTAAAGAGSAVAAGTASTATVAGTVLKIGLVVALATASTSSVDPGVTDDRRAGLPPEAPAFVPAVEEAAPKLFAGTTALVDEPAPTRIAPVDPTQVPPSNPGTQRPTVDQAEAGAGEAVAEPRDVASSPPSGGVEEVGGGRVEPVVNDVVEMADEEANGVAETVETVVETVTTVVNDVVDTVDEVVDETVGTVNDTVVEPVVTVVDTVDDSTNAVDNAMDTVNTVDTVVDGVTGGVTSVLSR